MPKSLKPSKVRGIRWSEDELARIRRAAAKLRAQPGARTTASDVIRHGTMSYVQSVLGAA